MEVRDTLIRVLGTMREILVEAGKRNLAELDKDDIGVIHEIIINEFDTDEYGDSEGYHAFFSAKNAENMPGFIGLHIAFSGRPESGNFRTVPGDLSIAGIDGEDSIEQIDAMLAALYRSA